ncbi:TWiK family of potassium channels protein 7-like 1 [Homarus americanus]|uniref:TWiK family of potassium channels protein 7-like 1 n=1 Tax=Homarus americanus TaxID=6706 RepID=A0A8J5JQ27_HOMAM|nr:TWiK family of potassium channels protein 7-like 1 [Homarus americanus]
MYNGMPSSGWLSSITRHFSRTPTLPHAHTGECGPTGGNGIATVSSQDPRNVTQSITPPSRPTTPWSLDTLDDEIQRAHGTTPLTGNGKTSHAYYDTHSGYVAAPSMMEGYGHGSQSYPHSSRPTSAASRPSSAASRPSSGVSRPASAASRLSTPAHSLLRAQTHAQTTAAADSAVPLPQQVDEGELYQSYPGETSMESRGHYYIPPVIPPLYDRPVAAPTPASTRCSTPVWDLDGEKRVRFLEPEVVGDVPSRPSSVNSQYSQVLKNSTRFAFQPSQPLSGEVGGHNLRFCNCPCHFIPSGRRSTGVQVKRTDPEPPRPRHYRLFLTPTTQGLDHLTLGTKSLSLVTRALLSQVGLMLVVVAWWVVGAAIFSTVEGAAESDTVNRMATLRTDLVLGLATELRQVLPYETVWRTKIETYMERLETAVLDAARAGYASRAPTWTMSGALLYSASLTTLVGPSGMTVRTGFSRIFAVLFSLVGAPLVLLLAISGAFTIREGVGKAWAWRCGFGKQARVADGRGQVVEGRAGQYGSGRGGSAASTLNLAGRPQSSTSAGVGPGGEQGVRITPNGPGELPGSIRPPNSAKPRLWGGTADIQQQSRVQALDSTLRSSSILSSTLRDTDHSSSSSATNSVSGSAQNTLSNSSQFRTVGDEQTMGVNPAIQRRGRYPPPPRQGSRRPHGVPWPVYLALLVAYIFLGLAIFAPIQRWSFPSSLYILMSTLMTLDHDSLGEKQQLGSSRIIVPYVVYMLLGLVVMATLVISVWSSICTSLVNTGKYLAVVRPTAR